MTGLVLALGALLVAAIEVVVLVALALGLAAAAYGVALGYRRARSTDAPPVRLGSVGVPRRLGLARESTLGGRLTFEQAVAFDGHAIGERLDRDVPGCDR